LDLAVADDGLGDHLQSAIHKRSGFEGGGALSPSPQGARRRRRQGARRFRVTTGEIQLLHHFGELTIFFAALGMD
jgi:hypothetical protein